MNRKGLGDAFDMIEAAVHEWSKAAKLVIERGEVEDIERLAEEIEFLRYVATSRQAEADRVVVELLVRGKL